MRSRTIAITTCTLLLMAFAALARWGVRDTSATFDEPVYAVASAALWEHGDYRVNPEHPPLWQYFAGLFAGDARPRLDVASSTWAEMAREPTLHWIYSIDTLYRTPGFDADGYLSRLRLGMLMFGVALGALIAWWSWQLAGAAGAVVATALFAFDPSFLGHSALLTNDVALSVMFFGSCLAAWRVGQAGSVRRIVALAICAALAPCMKFSGLLVPAFVVPAVLLARAVMPEPWKVVRWNLGERRQRAAAAILLCVFVGVITWAAIWASYRFRYEPTRDPQIRLNTTDVIRRIGEKRPGAERGPLVSVLMFADRHRLLPQAMVSGMLYSKMVSLGNSAYLMGEHSREGWLHYFPAAMLFKTPTATLVACAVALFFWPRIRREHLWTVLCIAIPFVIYGFFAVTTGLNIGVRHVLPLYPLIFVCLGAAAALVWQQYRRFAVSALALLGVGLATETLLNAPYHLSFFNTAAGGSRGGIKLLGDSNLDWGQDLKRLAAWRHQHPEEQLYLCYFGTADPAYYGIDYINLPGGYAWGPATQQPSAPGVVAISATQLQGIFLGLDQRRDYSALARSRPIGVIGSSIYLYRFPVAGAQSN